MSKLPVKSLWLLSTNSSRVSSVSVASKGIRLLNAVTKILCKTRVLSVTTATNMQNISLRIVLSPRVRLRRRTPTHRRMGCLSARVKIMSSLSSTQSSFNQTNIQRKEPSFSISNFSVDLLLNEVNDIVDNEDASINEVDDVTSSELIFEEIDALLDEKFATYKQGFLGKNQEFEKKLTQESPEFLSWLTWRLKDVRVLPPTQEVHHASTASDQPSYPERWLADSGATCHITNSDRFMSNVETVSVNVMVGNGKQVNCTRRGDVFIGSGEQSLKLLRVLYAPTFSKNIISIGLLFHHDQQNNASVIWSTTGMVLKTLQGGVLNFPKDGFLYYYEGVRTQMPISTEYCDSNYETVLDATVASTKPKEPKRISIDINVAHHKYGHVSEAALRATLKSVNIHPTGKLRSCEGCALAKAKAKKVSKIATERATIPGERIYARYFGSVLFNHSRF